MIDEEERGLKVRLWGCLTGLLLGSVCLPGASIAGGIAGKVVFVGTPPAPKKIEITSDQYVCGNDKDAGDLLLSSRKEIGNAVVWIENAPPSGTSPMSSKVEMDQKACVYIPRIVLVPVGGTVDFLNSDRLLHNIHAMPKLNASFNRTQPRNRTIPVTFDQPEIVEVTCDLHPWMKAWVVVVPHSFYAVTSADGQFAFDNLPTGQYRLRVWHETLGAATSQVTVGDQGAARTTIEMKLP